MMNIVPTLNTIDYIHYLYKRQINRLFISFIKLNLFLSFIHDNTFITISEKKICTMNIN